MNKLIGHLRGNAIGYLALFVALGGTGYAAVSLPAGSVGTPQLRNGAVTAKKLNGRSIAGYLAFWARVDRAGQAIGSSAPATTAGWSSGMGSVTFHGDLPRNCFPLANIGVAGDPAGHIGFAVSGSVGGSTTIEITMVNDTGLVGPEPVDVAEICP
jgi:hypothetical protein